MHTVLQEYVRRSRTEPMAKQREWLDSGQNAAQVLVDQTASVQKVGEKGRRVHCGFGRRARR